eukprot:CAMPEP_0182596684 /NCGR_PEP_ID=MMETSP1324-20130603/84724_1 /TAXON_ID=236786 /ORGANISM="Florenciella sp., Strain RCC1587" /LENGTH=36 /DNA_ID= /DNA_START= /DNA_END= /DNA_ORIENTATION=
MAQGPVTYAPTRATGASLSLMAGPVAAHHPPGTEPP